MKTRICDLLEIDLPIIQAPMLGSTTPNLVAAVSNAGGLGSHGATGLKGDRFVQVMAEIRAQTNRGFNLNFFTHDLIQSTPAQTERMTTLMRAYHDELGLDDVPPPKPLNMPFDAEQLENLLADPPSVVSFHYGLPTDILLQPIKDACIKILCSATTVAEARYLEAHGVDAIIAQGGEAGGHRGTFLTEQYGDALVGTMALVPQVVDAVNVPVIAAGGIADGRGMAAAIMLGAEGVQVGTAYLTMDEAGTDATYRSVLANAREDQTCITKVYSGRPARSVRNRYADEMAPYEDELPPFPITYNMNKTVRAAALKAGRSDLSPFWSGQAVALNRGGGAADLTRAIVAEADALLAKVAA
jgi:nitronate monooxygenase